MDNSKGLIGLLVVIAVVLAIVVFASMGGAGSLLSRGGSTAESPSTTGAGAETPGPSGTQGSTGTTDTASSTVTVSLPNLSATEKQVLTPPAQSASLAEQQAYADFVNKNAQNTTTLALGASCKVTPIVIRLKTGATVTVKNTDSKSHTLSFDSSHTLTVPAGGSKQIATSFFSQTGIHGYGCDNVGGAVGMMVVTK